MSKLKLTDLIELAKQGYTPDKVKELIELSTAEEAGDSSLSEEQPKEQPKEEDKPDTTATEVEQKAADTSADIVDYKKKVEELEKKLTETTSKLSELQKLNTRQNADTGDKPSDADVFAAAMKSFM